MYTYAQLNQKNVVVGISELSGEVNTENMINITDLEQKPSFGYIYNRETNTFIAPEPVVEPEPEQKLTLEERIEQLQQDNLTLMDALAVAYEETAAARADNLIVMDAIGTLCEEIILSREETI